MDEKLKSIEKELEEVKKELIKFVECISVENTKLVECNKKHIKKIKDLQETLNRLYFIRLKETKPKLYEIIKENEKYQKSRSIKGKKVV